MDDPKKAPANLERCRLWQGYRSGQGLGGEYLLGLQLNGRSYSEEEAAMVAALFGR